MSSCPNASRPLNRILIICGLVLVLCAWAATATFNRASANSVGRSVTTCQTKIAFFSNRDSNGGVYLMNPDGSDPINISNGGDQFPSISLDGTKVAFSSDRDGDYEIYVMNADGSG